MHLTIPLPSPQLEETVVKVGLVEEVMFRPVCFSRRTTLSKGPIMGGAWLIRQHARLSVHELESLEPQGVVREEARGETGPDHMRSYIGGYCEDLGLSS